MSKPHFLEADPPHGLNRDHCSQCLSEPKPPQRLTFVMNRSVDTHIAASAAAYLSAVLSYLYYPIALLCIGKHELRLFNTRNAAAAFSRLLDAVREGRLLDESDVAYVVSEKWEEVPWSYVPSSLDYSGR